MKTVKTWIGLCVACLFWTTVVADDEAGYYDAPPLKVTANIRQYEVGAHIEVFGGVNFAQTGHVNVSTPDLPGVSTNFSTDNSLGGIVGIKGGYVWPGWGNKADAALGVPKAVSGDFALLPAADYEFFWTGFRYKGSDDVGGTPVELRANINAYVFSLDPKLEFQIGIFRPYFGLGLGGAYITADDGHVSASGVGSADLIGGSSDWCFTVQALAGVEIFIAKNWAITLDYKYLDFISPTFGHSSDSNPNEIPLRYRSDSIGQHLVTAGINYYF